MSNPEEINKTYCAFTNILFVYCHNISNYLAGYVFNNRKTFIVACAFHPSAYQKQTHDILSVLLIFYTFTFFSKLWL